MSDAIVGMKLQVESGYTGLRLVGHGAGKSKQVGRVVCPLQCEAQVFVAPGQINWVSSWRLSAVLERGLS
jgi:hypothetical protein